MVRIRDEFDEIRIQRFESYLRTGTVAGTELFTTKREPSRLRVIIERECVDDSPTIRYLQKVLEDADSKVYFYDSPRAGDNSFWGVAQALSNWSRPDPESYAIKLDASQLHKLSACPVSQFVNSPLPAYEAAGKDRLDAVAVAYFASALYVPLVIRSNGDSRVRHLKFGTRFTTPETAIPIVAHYCRIAKRIYWPGLPFGWINRALGPLEFHRAVVALRLPSLIKLLGLVEVYASAAKGDSSCFRLVQTAIGRLSRALAEFDVLLKELSAPADSFDKSRYGHPVHEFDVSEMKVYAIEGSLSEILFNLIGALDALTQVYLRVILLPSGRVTEGEIRFTPSIYDKHWFRDNVSRVMNESDIADLKNNRHLIELIARLRNTVHGPELNIASSESGLRGIRDSWEMIPWFAQTEWVVHLDLVEKHFWKLPENQAARWGLWHSRMSPTASRFFERRGVPKCYLKSPDVQLGDSPEDRLLKYLLMPKSLVGDVATLAYQSINDTLRYIESFAYLMTSRSPEAPGVNVLADIEFSNGSTGPAAWMNKFNSQELDELKNQLRLLSLFA